MGRCKQLSLCSPRQVDPLFTLPCLPISGFSSQGPQIPLEPFAWKLGVSLDFCGKLSIGSLKGLVFCWPVVATLSWIFMGFGGIIFVGYRKRRLEPGCSQA